MKTLRPYQINALQETWEMLIKTTEPVLLMASVGSGKSLMISEILLRMERNKKRALCLVNNGELVRNNSETYNNQGGNSSVYSASLNKKDISNHVVFATPQTVLKSINKNKKISNIKFNLIVIDEAHQINYKNDKNSFMIILNHYKKEYPQMRILGATGTNFRYKGEPIVGKECLFKTQVGNISTLKLINDGYLIKPKFEIDSQLIIDFSQLKLNKTGKFDSKELQEILDKNHRLTGEILIYLHKIMENQNRFGCFIFCCTKKHCQEALNALPKDQSAIITGETSQKEREIILNKARKGEIKYLINVQVLTVGVDVPMYDTILFLRPTESLVLAVQMIGRALRIYPNKKDALILDCAGNIERHKDWDDPIIVDAIKQIDNEKEAEYVFECQKCHEMNTEHSRRCIGIINEKRCDYYFTFKDCHLCFKKNDISARNCKWCSQELIDPNEKLNKNVILSTHLLVDVVDCSFSWFKNKFHEWYKYKYKQEFKTISNYFYPLSSTKAKNYFYASFVRYHCEKPSDWYLKLQNQESLEQLSQNSKVPLQLLIYQKENEWIIKRKIF